MTYKVILRRWPEEVPPVSPTLRVGVSRVCATGWGAFLRVARVLWVYLSWLQGWACR